VIHRTPARRTLSLIGAVMLIVAACSTGGDASSAPSAAPSKAPSAAAPSPGDAASEGATNASVAVASSSLGKIVVDAEGRTLYLFTSDTQGAGTSVCNDECAANWPPLVIDEGAAPTPGNGVTGELGTATRDDGTTQVTLNGWPLYYFAADQAAGDTNGQGVNDVWFVIAPDGEAVDGGKGTDEY